MIARCISILTLCLLSATGAAYAQSFAASSTVRRVIVKPKAIVDEATLMQSIYKALPGERRVTFFRAMSGNAFVLNVVAPATNDDVPKIISLLTATQLFEYVEQDIMMEPRQR